MNVKKISIISLVIKLLLSLGIFIPNNAIAFLSIYVPAVSALFEETLFLHYGIAFLVLFVLHIAIIGLYAFLKGKALVVFGVLTLILLVGDIISHIFFYLKNSFILPGVLGVAFDFVCITLVVFDLCANTRKL
ncbi:MAG: hypothetical protein Q4B92_04960 [Ruminococcus sp.]|nr:hypothetical protein [Ruminococcus sp.]